MPDLPARPDLGQLRHQAKDLLHSAKGGDEEALARIRAVSDRPALSSAQLAVAREYGFASWPRLKREVERREILDDRDLTRLERLLAEEPQLATSSMEHWCDHPRGATPLGYTAMLRYDTASGAWRDLNGTGAVARRLLDAGAPVDGEPGDRETPLITAASYGDAEVAGVLIESGADVDATAAADAGGVPNGSALLHAAVFGMTDVVDLLVRSGARIHGIEEAAAAGDVSGWLDDSTPLDSRTRALVMAADHQRLDVIDQLIAAGTPVDAVDPAFGGHPLRTAAANGRPASVRRLLAHGADADLRDPEHDRTPLDWCRHSRAARRRQSSARRSRGDPRAAHLRRPEPSPMTSVVVVIEGADLPGRRCGPNPEGRFYDNVHVGLWHRDGPVQLVPGDASTACWEFEVVVRDVEEGLDLSGPFVAGRRGERSLGLVWGNLADDDFFDVFRAAKLRLSDLDPALVEQAVREERRLVCSLGLTDDDGHPRCASVRPPDVTWSVRDVS